VNIVNRADGFAGETLNTGSININRFYNGSANAATSTLVHESNHVTLLMNTGNGYGLRDARSGQYAARCGKILFNNGRRPTAVERESIMQTIINQGY